MRPQGPRGSTSLMSAGHYVELRPYGAYALGTVFTSRFLIRTALRARSS